jgi:hypothetical protein
MSTCTQGRKCKVVAVALLGRGADLGTKAASMTKAALATKQDDLLAALIQIVKQSVLDTMDLNYRQMVEASLPKAAAACARRETGGSDCRCAISHAPSASFTQTCSCSPSPSVCLTPMQYRRRPD